ncbi:MAG: hypothetical protein ACFFAE_09005 [Candidatus Hodarchaeota archaeon]
MKIRKNIRIMLLFIFFLPLVDSVSACTIFTVTDGQSTFFCANEDNSEAFQWRIWFNPATKDKYGRVFLGFRIVNNLDVPMAGLNDQGLAIDLNAVSYAPIAKNPEREDYYGAIFTKWLTECATVNEVREQLPLYNLIDLEQNPDQIHVADKTGNAMVIAVDSDGELNTTDITEDYLVSTNFNLNNKEILNWELHHSGRYNTTATGLETMLQNNNLSVDGCRDILEETALNPNLGYGFVADLTNGLIYLYSHDDFERTAVLDIHKELAKGSHSYAIETLVTQQTGIIKPYIRNSILLSSLILISVIGLSCGIYFFNVRPLLHSVPIEEKSNTGLDSFILTQLKTLQPKTRFLIACVLSVFTFLFLKTFIRIGPIYVTFDWTNIIYFYFTLLPVIVIGTNFRPSVAFILSSLGIIVDELVFCFLHGYGGELWIQVILSLSSLVGTSVIISLIREKNKFLAFFLGFLWYIIGFYIPAYLYYCELFYYDALGLFFYIIAHALVSVLFIPAVLLFNKAFQKLFQKQDLESIVFLDKPVKESSIS